MAMTLVCMHMAVGGSHKTRLYQFQTLFFLSLYIYIFIYLFQFIYFSLLHYKTKTQYSNTKENFYGAIED